MGNFGKVEKEFGIENLPNFKLHNMILFISVSNALIHNTFSTECHISLFIHEKNPFAFLEVCVCDMQTKLV